MTRREPWREDADNNADPADDDRQSEQRQRNVNWGRARLRKGLNATSGVQRDALLLVKSVFRSPPAYFTVFAFSSLILPNNGGGRFGGGGDDKDNDDDDGDVVKPYGEKIVHSGVKAPNLAW